MSSVVYGLSTGQGWAMLLLLNGINVCRYIKLVGSSNVVTTKREGSQTKRSDDDDALYPNCDDRDD
jgi:hypothetical protein